RGTVLLRDVFADVLAFRAHLRVELEGLELDPRRQFILQAPERRLERAQPDGAPGTRNVRDEVDSEGGFHGGGLQRMSACRFPVLTAWANPPPARGLAPRYTGRPDAAAVRGRPFD